MSRKKLLKHLGKYLSRDSRKQNKHLSNLKALLKQLKQKELELKRKLVDDSSKKKPKQLQKEIQVVHAQRKKGIRILRKNGSK